MRHRMLHKLIPVLLFFTVFSIRQSMAQAVIGPELSEQLNTLSDPVEVIVTFQGSEAPTAAERDLLSQAGISVGYTFQTLPMAGAIADRSSILSLAENPQVRSIYLNRRLNYYNDDARKQTGVDKVQNSQEFTAQNGGLPISGKGIGVVVNDSGIDGTHPDLEYLDAVVQNVLGSTNLQAYSDLGPVSFVENVPNTDTNSGHGTHVAGTVGGRGIASAGKYQGVATGADLIGYGSGGVLFVLDGVGGFDYALTHQFEYGIRVITNSWGGSGAFDPNDPVNIASKMAYDRGIVTLFAAGNSGPGENTHNPYGKAPWVISVGAGTKAGELADFSSRGTEGFEESFTFDGETFTYKDEPTLVGPGVEIVSTRTVSPIGLLSTDQDVENIEAAYLPYYTTLQGTSMATPHVAGIVALMLEADPSLSPDEVKDILRQTTTNMYGRETWEVGTGYVNAFAAVQKTLDRTIAFGSSVNAFRTFNSNAYFQKNSTAFQVNYDPTGLTSTSYDFSLNGSESVVSVKISAEGVEGQTGNSVSLVLTAPDGTVYSTGIPVLFATTYAREVQVANPMAGNWNVRVEGLRGDAANTLLGLGLPETIFGTVTTKTSTGYDGLDDIQGDPAETVIKLAVSERLMDGYSDKKFAANRKLNRIELADYLMMGQQVRQHLPLNGAFSFGDVSGELNTLLAESAVNRGAALRDTNQVYGGVMKAASAGSFDPDGRVSRAELAYSLVQGLGMQAIAEQADTDPVTVVYEDQRIPLEDSDQIPNELKGHVQVALNLGIINADFSLEQGPFDLTPTVTATLSPNENIERVEYAYAVTRTLEANPNAAPAKTVNGSGERTTDKAYTLSLDKNYPNPFNPTTNISYSLDKPSDVKLTIYNIVGKKVATLVDGNQSAGSYTVSWDAAGFASGVYITRMQVGSRTFTQTMNLIK